MDAKSLNISVGEYLQGLTRLARLLPPLLNLSSPPLFMQLQQLLAARLGCGFWLSTAMYWTQHHRWLLR